MQKYLLAAGYGTVVRRNLRSLARHRRATVTVTASRISLGASLDPSRAAGLATMSDAAPGMKEVLESIATKMEAAVATAKADGAFVKEPRLVAVSKTKPAEAILEAYTAGHRIFGENYVQELVEKANNDAIPKDIEFHFIGTLQSNKAKLVAAIPNLTMVETVSSIKLANVLQKALNNLDRADGGLAVLVQVNTSGEANKGGVEPDAVVQLVAHIMTACPKLRFAGVMTIGQYGRVTEPGESNPDFVRLIGCRDALCTALELDRDALEVSMGMSGDFVHAIELGATNIRVGSTIFGAREYANK